MRSSNRRFVDPPVVKLAFSPCPNDTFIFDALVHGKIDTEGIVFDYKLADVEELNQMAIGGQADMIKVSYHAWLYIREDYALLDSGSAMGFGNGPLVIAKKACSLKDLENVTVAIPGEYTTANLLLRIFAPGAVNKRTMVFNQIENAILEDKAGAGVIIHENRFTYQDKGLVKIADLGEMWEEKTSSPIPLGAIVVKRNLGREMTELLNRVMKRSVEHALGNPGSPMDFVRENAQEMDEKVMRKHIDLYVNEFTREMGEPGKNAIMKLIEKTRDFLDRDKHI